MYAGVFHSSHAKPPDVGFLAIGPNPKESSLLYLALVVHNFEYSHSLQISFEFPAIGAKSSRHCMYCSKSNLQSQFFQNQYYDIIIIPLK
jgi:hypothetical protein